tara:strand:- start:129 stop:413 length:285 start_codon:yes stop_codon:yes gene_type:complete
MDKIIKYVIPSIAFFTLLCFFQTCGSKGKIQDVKFQVESLQKTVDSLHVILDAKPSQEEVQYEMEQTMYKFLIYEDDLDKGKVSLSEIKNRIDE